MSQLHWPLWTVEDWERNAARALSLGWALFWAWFGFAAGAAEYATFSEIVFQTLPGLLFLAAACFAWFKPAAGGASLLVMGLAVLAAYWSSAGDQGTARMVSVSLVLAGPPLGAGLLFLASAGRPNAPDTL